MNTKKVAIIVLLVCVLFIGGIAAISILSSPNGGWSWSWSWLGFGGKHINIDESADFTLDGVSDVEISLPTGNVTVEAGDPGVTLKGYITAAEEKDQYLFVRNEGGKLSIEFDPGDLPLVQDNNMQMTVKVPVELAANLKITNSSGDIHITEISMRDLTVFNASGNMDILGCTGGTLHTDLSSGNMTLIAGDFTGVDANCQSGNVRIENKNGPIAVQNMSGNINISIVSGTITADNASGNTDIEISGAQVSAINAGVSSGNITLRLDPQAAFNLDARTSSGNVSSQFDTLVSGGTDNNSLKGECNGGGELVKLSVSSGNVTVLKR